MAAADYEIDTPPKRARLPARKNPYWQGISGGRGGVSLGYRTAVRGAGAWVAKIVLNGKRLEERIGDANDDGAPLGALPYRAAVSAALEWGRQQSSAIEGQDPGKIGKGPTVGSAVEAYAAARRRRAPAAGLITEGRLKKHVLADERFSSTLLSKLRASNIEAWRGRINVREDQDKTDGADDADKSIAPATLNRLLNDVRAALNEAAEKYRRELPAHLPGEIKAGTKSLHVEGDARRQLLTDGEVRSVVAAAFAVDEDGDFGRLVLLAAATGARYSQLRALRVADVQAAHSRVMIPGARKGRAAKAKAAVAMPLAADHLTMLAAALTDRANDQPLLERWAYRRVKSAALWEKDRRRAWGPAYEIEKMWSAAIAKAGVPSGTIMYALRHSSIVRGLKAGLPIRLVAALHDTSVEMIEAHYSAFIVDASEELARRATLSLI